jgi:hypothetical protein
VLPSARGKTYHAGRIEPPDNLTVLSPSSRIALQALRITRETVRSAERPKRLLGQGTILPPAVVPILGDDQIEWAAEYVAKRMADVTVMLQATLEQLDAILA